MNYYKIILLCFSFLCYSQFSIAETTYNTSSLETIENPPPVEKNKKKLKRKRQKRSKFKAPKKIKEEQNYGTLILLLFGLIFPLFVLIGSFIFGFGILITAAWITGTVFIGIGDVFGLLIIALFAPGGYKDSGSEIYAWIMFFLNFLVGLSFLIFGLLSAGPIAWIMGAILLGVAALILSLFIGGRVHRNKQRSKFNY